MQTAGPIRLADVMTEIDGQDLSRLGRMIDAESHLTLYAEGDAVSSVYLVEKGQLALERLNASGDRQILAFVFPGDFIGLDLAGRHLSGATTLTPCRLRLISRAALERMATERPALATALNEQTRRIVVYMLDHICALGRMTARQRLVFFLLHLSERQVAAAPQDLRQRTRLQLTMTRQDIADFLGIRMETAIRGLSALAKEGLIELETDHQIKLADPDRLAMELP